MIEIYYFANKPIGEECLKPLVKLHLKKLLEIRLVVTSYGEKSWWGKTKITDICKEFRIRCEDSKKSDWKRDMNEISESSWLVSIQSSIVFERQILTGFGGKTANLHLAPLPKYGGWYGPSHAIIEDSKTYGWTIHRMTEKLDQGEILSQGSVEISSRETAKSLYEKTQKDAIFGFKNFMESVQSNTIQPKEMDLSAARFFDRNSLDTYRNINLDKVDVEECERIYRALYFPPFPSPTLEHRGISENKQI